MHRFSFRVALAFALLFGCACGYVSAQQVAHYRRHGAAVLPDSRVTPGAADRRLTVAKLCDSTFRTARARHVTDVQKRQICAAYGIAAGCPGPGYEIDHLISLELGGANDSANLWPQPADAAGIIGFHAKDKVENAAHRAVCTGQITLQQAQNGLRGDWYAFALAHGWLTR